jgi:hypothetical protein
MVKCPRCFQALDISKLRLKPFADWNSRILKGWNIGEKWIKSFYEIFFSYPIIPEVQYCIIPNKNRLPAGARRDRALPGVEDLSGRTDPFFECRRAKLIR